MKLHFNAKEVQKILDHAKNAPETATLYGEETGVGLWLVGDQGVYLMSNGKPHLPKDENNPDRSSFVAYAKECNPEGDFDEWYENKRLSFGADDGCEFISADVMESAIKNSPKKGKVILNVTPKTIGTVESIPVNDEEQKKYDEERIEYNQLVSKAKAEISRMDEKMSEYRNGKHLTLYVRYFEKRKFFIGKANRARKHENKCHWLNELMKEIKHIESKIEEEVNG